MSSRDETSASAPTPANVSGVSGPEMAAKPPAAETMVEPDVQFPCFRFCCQPSLKTIEDIPKWYTSNSAIIYGYRPINNSLRDCFVSVFQIHNETGNIWTHLVGAVMFIGLYINLLTSPPMPGMKFIDHLLLNVFFVGVIGCMVFSTLFHILVCYSEKVFRIFAKLDYFGITLLIACSFIPWLYYAYYNSKFYQSLFIGISLFFGIVCVIISLFDRFSQPYYRRVRTFLFLGDGLSAFLPAIHWMVRELAYGKSPFLGLNHQPAILLVIMGASYTVGALIYLFKIPEYFFLGRFDLWFNSHQLFHVLVLCGALLYYHSFLQIMQIRLTNPDHFYN